MALDPKLRSAGLHLGTGIASAVATVAWMSSHSVDLYAIVDQINTVVVELGKLLALVGAVATAVTQVWSSRQKGLTADVVELAKNPEATGVRGVITEDNPAGRSLSTMPGPVEVAGTTRAAMIATPAP